MRFTPLEELELIWEWISGFLIELLDEWFKY